MYDICRSNGVRGSFGSHKTCEYNNCNSNEPLDEPVKEERSIRTSRIVFDPIEAVKESLVPNKRR